MEYQKPVGEMNIGDNFSGYYLLNDIQVKMGKNGKPYLAVKLTDAQDSIEAKMWNYTGDMESSDSGSIAFVAGTVTEFNGGSQVNLRQVRLADERDVGKYTPETLAPSAPIDKEFELESIRKLIASMEDPDYRLVAETMLERHLKAFSSIPAAKTVHHEFLNGLLMHTSTMMAVADYLADVYSYVIDRSLLLAGTLLHDFGKEEEFVFSSVGLAADYSVAGNLLGHLYIGARNTAEVCKELNIPEEKSMLLQHMILSHHGEPEYGAAVRPKCAESELLSMIDLIDSKMEIFTKACEATPEGSFSQKVPAIDRMVYHHRKTEKE